jgi:uncharacterized membrane protein
MSYELEPVNVSADADRVTYQWVGLILTTGMYASFAAMGVGLAWWLATGTPGGDTLEARVVPIDQIVPELMALNPLALINLGVLLLLATPAFTLIAEIVTYSAARNWRYAGIAALVSSILLLSLALSMKWIRLF